MSEQSATTFHTHLLPKVERLDIVQDCQDLRGTFPPNVQLKFIYWRHGTHDDGEPASDKMARLAPHVLGADRVAMEIAGSVHDNPAYDVRREFNTINDYLRQKGNKTSVDDYYRGRRPTTSFADATYLAVHLHNLGQTKPPRFFPIDVYGDTSVSILPPTYEFEPMIQHSAQLTRYREGVVLRQLHAQAAQIGKDRKPHQIAVIYGAGHSLTSVGARQLGAPVSRVFVDKPLKMPAEYAEKELRFQGGSHTQDRINTAGAAAFEASMVTSLARRMKHKELTLEGSRQCPQTTYMNVGMLLLRDRMGTLSASQKDTLNTHLSAIYPYLRERSVPSLLQRRAAKRSVRQLITLASEIIHR